VTSVEVHDDVGEVEVLDGIGDTVTVTRSRVGAGGQVGVGDQVRKRVGLNDESEGSVGVRLQDLDDGWEREMKRQ
jgi:hypothetical protein